MSSVINIVLVEPEIPQNTGNIGRTCLGFGACLHLVGKLGFSLEAKDLKRAGLDYWPKLNFRHYPDWATFLKTVPTPQAGFTFFSVRGQTDLGEIKFGSPAYLVFGSESRGFPPSFYKLYKNQLVRIPIQSEIRSLNLATAVGIATYQAVHQLSLAGTAHA